MDEVFQNYKLLSQVAKELGVSRLALARAFQRGEINGIRFPVGRHGWIFVKVDEKLYHWRTAIYSQSHADRVRKRWERVKQQGETKDEGHGMVEQG